jgi:ferredoxin
MAVCAEPRALCLRFVPMIRAALRYHPLMTFVITSACIDVKDLSCIEVCPVDCIYHLEADRMCYINPDECIDCNVCVEACPVAAIYADREVPSEQREFQLINQLWFEDKEAARAKVDQVTAV